MVKIDLNGSGWTKYICISCNIPGEDTIAFNCLKIREGNAELTSHGRRIITSINGLLVG